MMIKFEEGEDTSQSVSNEAIHVGDSRGGV